jgi:cellulose synthase/poly-beta-1,6-N-acetylglucosamine synthase-like glycosyltransferase
MKVAIITSVFYPECSLGKFDLVKKVLNIIPDYAGVDYDLFIMNDGAEDHRLDEFIKSYDPRNHCKNIKYTCRENKGITKSLNELLSQVDESYDYICLLDLDVFVPVYWLKKCISVLDNNEEVGICGVLVEDELNFDFQTGVGQTKDGVLFSHAPNIGGACLVFRAEELKAYGWDETLTSDHIDAYILTRYRASGKTSYTILDRGYHPKELYESKQFIESKLERFQEQLPIFFGLINKLKKKDTKL